MTRKSRREIERDLERLDASADGTDGRVRLHPATERRIRAAFDAVEDPYENPEKVADAFVYDT
jgi:hypothetical protein